MGQKLHGMLPLELMVDHAMLDAEHDEIFCRIEAIKESALSAERMPEDELLALADCFARHFASEEQLAREVGMEFSEHAHEHAQALRMLDKACDDLRAGGLDLRSFLRCLEYWFEHHINAFDKPLGRRLAQRAAGSRGARAAGIPSLAARPAESRPAV